MFTDLTNLSYEERTRIFADKDAAREYVESVRWQGKPVCPHCGVEDEKHYKITPKKGSSTRPGVWKCRTCRKQFTVKVGTIFEGSHIGLHKWLHAIHSMCASKKGISAKQLERELGVTYKTAWFMCHRIRWAMQALNPEGPKDDSDPEDKLTGVVEVDETYVGGRKKRVGAAGPTSGGKSIVFSLVSRDGEVRSFHVGDVKSATLQGIMKRNIEGEARIMTDQMHSYWGVDKHFSSHEVVDHGKGEYIRGDVGTNFAESYFSLLKRGIFGVFHHVSKKHLQRYLEEFDFRWSTRKVDDLERLAVVLHRSEGKRLFYREPRRLPA